MPVCEKCGSEVPVGAVYCPECGYRTADTEELEPHTSELGTKMGEAQSYAQPTTVRPVRVARRPAEVLSAIGIAGKVAIVGALLAITGFFVPSTNVVPPGLVITRSLAMVGGGFFLIPVLALLVIVLVYLSGQIRPQRNRLLIQATIIAIGAFALPAALYVWLNGLIGGLLILLGFLAVIGGGYALMSDTTRSLS